MANPLPIEMPRQLPRQHLDTDAVMVCRRLQEAGHETYMVGGCVRDILLGRVPKDFDIGTLATPSQIRRLFRNCRIIGRRFKLAHIVFGSKIIEVATFRGGDEDEEEGQATTGDPEDRLIVRANNFGTPEQDAISRDFTVNALFYDPIKEEILDHVGGYTDLRAGIMRTIGKPSIRFEEDPVRILRAVKFASRLGFEIEPETRAAMAEIAPDIMRCPVPRVTEEVYRLVESGYFLRAVEVMDETDVLSVLLPEIAAELEMNRDGYRKHLEALDHVVRAHHRVAREFLLTALYYPLAMSIVDEGDAGPGWGKDVEEWFRPIGVRMHIAVKHRYRMRALLSLMGRFLAPPNEKRRSRLSTHDRRVLPQALTLLRIHHHAQGGVADIYERWRTVAAENQITWVPVADTGGDSVDGERRDGSRRQKGRRRRRGRRRDEEAQ